MKNNYDHNDRFLLHLLGKLPDHYQMDKKEKDKYIRRVELGLNITSIGSNHKYRWGDRQLIQPVDEALIDNAVDQLNLITRATKLSVKLADNVLNGFDVDYTNTINALIAQVDEMPDKAGCFDWLRSDLKNHLKRMIRMEKRESKAND